MKKLTNRPKTSPPATYGGTGWQPRHASLHREIAEGKIWHPCGCCSESSKLKEVLLSWPGEEIRFDCPPDEMLMIERINMTAIRSQTEKIAAFFESQNVTVHLVQPTLPPPNFIFQRDLFWATPEGVVLARPAALQRAGEERYTAKALATIGVPISMYFRRTATFEGADALWLNEKTVLLGTGVRTNAEAARQLSTFLAEMNVELVEIPLPEKSQHLLGLVNFVDSERAIIHGGKITTHLADILAARGIKTIVLSDSEELNIKLAMNFVTLAPGKIVMPSGAPITKGKLQAAGLQVHEINISEYLKAAGGLACLTGILRRE